MNVPLPSQNKPFSNRSLAVVFDLTEDELKSGVILRKGSYLLAVQDALRIQCHITPCLIPILESLRRDVKTCKNISPKFRLAYLNGSSSYMSLFSPLNVENFLLSKEEREKIFHSDSATSPDLEQSFQCYCGYSRKWRHKDINFFCRFLKMVIRVLHTNSQENFKTPM
jgi:hypothetical protein